MKTEKPPIVGANPPRNQFGPRQFLLALDVLSQRRARQVARQSSLSRLRGIA